jgi:putative cardiolipin synthase
MLYLLLRTISGLAAAALLVGCAALPPRGAARPSYAIPVDFDAHLGRIVAAAAPEDLPPEHSGFRVLPDAPFALDARLALIEQAQISIDVQYYILAADSVGLTFLDALERAGRRGVRVRLLVDDLYLDGEQELRGLDQLPGFEVRVFNPLPARGGSWTGRLLRSAHEFSRINHRMHNKLIVADGVLSISGGRNIAAEYFMLDPAANFVDLDVLAAGAAARVQAQGFDRYWNSAHAFPISSLPIAASTERRRERPPAPPIASPDASVDTLGRPPVSTELAAGRLDLVWAPFVAVADDPEKIVRPTGEERFAGSVSEQTLKVIASACCRLFLASPYLVPGKRGMEVLRQVADRGVRTTVVTNSLGSTDEPLIYPWYRRYRSEMLDLGIEMYEIGPTLTRRASTLGRFGQSMGRLHSKLAIADDRWFYIGSMNLDRRSASINTEAGLLIDSPELVAEFGKVLQQDRFQSAYKLRKGEAGRIEWLEPQEDGNHLVHEANPQGRWGAAFRAWLLSLFIDEEWL